MPNYLRVFLDGYGGYASYLWYEITHPGWHNYFYWLIGVSLFFLLLEWKKPWREGQARFRKDFWLDAFYMFFNFFLFSLIIYNAASDVVVNFFNHIVYQLTDIDLRKSNPMYAWPLWAILLAGFIVRDFVQWWTHRLLHRVSFLWEFHKVHHSVQEMGFAAHLRYHWMETIVYRTIEYLPLALLGIGLYDFFIIHIITLTIGHYNHSNISVSGRVTGGVLGFFIAILIVTESWDISILHGSSLGIDVLAVIFCTMVGVSVFGPLMKKIFNHPEMHIWHHAKDLPVEKKYGVNFGISLALWDYLFDTVHMPHSGRDIALGFPGINRFPDTFKTQMLYGFRKRK
jgi:sterol desaturase/sphingolipid hydroxylase (fatty acid hydroxylase superfamily)